jgi:hypothetical protein
MLRLRSATCFDEVYIKLIEMRITLLGNFSKQ